MKSKRKMLKSVENMLPPVEDEVANVDKNPPNRMSKRKRGQDSTGSISLQKVPFKKTRTHNQAQETGHPEGRCYDFDFLCIALPRYFDAFPIHLYRRFKSGI